MELLEAFALLQGSHCRRTAGRALAARHTWDAAALAHLELYRRLRADGSVTTRGA